MGSCAQIKGSGIGTSATRAEILKKLSTIQYIAINKKTQIITPTLMGEMIYEVVDSSIKHLLNPELTASWEKGLTYVAEGSITEEEYMEKTAFITGAGGYIGTQTAITLAREGINIAVCDISEKSVRITVDKVNAMGGNAKGYVSDVTDSTAIEYAVRKAAADFGGLDIMIHIAGGSARIAGGKYVPLVEQDENVIDRVLKVNLYGAIWTNRAAAKIMIKQGRGGKIRCQNL